MPLVLTSLADLGRAGFDDIIDVRAPAEWAEANSSTPISSLTIPRDMRS
jgi:rhodanese-related sulfurtransferase